MAQTIKRIVPLVRNSGGPIPDLVQAANWVDTRVLAAGVAETYTFPIDANLVKATVLRFFTNGGPVYLNFNATAAIPVADNSNGDGPIIFQPGKFLAVPDGKTSVSMIAPDAMIVSIEAWS